jgi:hypothetical protein
MAKRSNAVSGPVFQVESRTARAEYRSGFSNQALRAVSTQRMSHQRRMPKAQVPDEHLDIPGEPIRAEEFSVRPRRALPAQIEGHRPETGVGEGVLLRREHHVVGTSTVEEDHGMVRAPDVRVAQAASRKIESVSERHSRNPARSESPRDPQVGDHSGAFRESIPTVTQ